MALNQQLKLTISTALDAAGIKATEAQIAKMANSVGSANKKMADGMTAAEKSLGRLPGPLGKLQGAFGGLAARAMSVVGAFKAGWDVGTQLREKVLRPLIPAYDNLFTYAERAKKAEQEYFVELKKSGEQLEKMHAEQQDAAAIDDAVTAKRLQNIDKETAAYAKLAMQRARVASAMGDAEDAQMERDRFEDVTMLRVQGFEKEAEAASRAYDVVKARREAERSLAAFDRESAKLTEEKAKKQAALAVAHQKTERAIKREQAASKRVADVYASEGTYYADKAGIAAYEKAVKDARKNLDIMVAKRKAAEEAEAKRAADVEAMTAEDETMALRRATLVERNNLSVDRAAAAFDAYARENGAEIGDYIEHLVERVGQNTDSSADSAALIETAENTRSLAEKLDELLQMKGG